MLLRDCLRLENQMDEGDAMMDVEADAQAYAVEMAILRTKTYCLMWLEENSNPPFELASCSVATERAFKDEYNREVSKALDQAKEKAKTLEDDEDSILEAITYLYESCEIDEEYELKETEVLHLPEKGTKKIIESINDLIMNAPKAFQKWKEDELQRLQTTISTMSSYQNIQTEEKNVVPPVKSKKGRPRISQAQKNKFIKIWHKWCEARDDGFTKKEFCRDEGISEKELDKGRLYLRHR